MIGSLFSGIGGLELGLERAGLGPVAWQVEIDPFCRLVLEKHWPEALRFEDVQSVGAAQLAPVDLICGGFPCQDVSGAGRGAGLAGERSGLWREYSRIVGELLPRWVVVENVTSGAIRWLDEIVCELDQLGYESLPVPLSAANVGALHLRQRIFVVANRYSERSNQRESGTGRERAGWSEPSGSSSANVDSGWKLQPQRSVTEQWRRPGDCAAKIPDTLRERRERPRTESLQIRSGFASGYGWPPEPEVAPVVHGVSGGLVGRQRRRRVRALGNSVVPQCAEVVGWVIRELEHGKAGGK